MLSGIGLGSVKSTAWSFREHKLDSKLLYCILQVSVNTSSKYSDTFWPLWKSDTQVHRHTTDILSRKKHTYAQNKIYFQIKRDRFFSFYGKKSLTLSTSLIKRPCRST